MALTASASTEAREDITRAGALGVLVKGGSSGDLTRMIARAAGRDRLTA